MNLQKRGEVEKLQIIMPRDQEEEQTQKKAVERRKRQDQHGRQQETRSSASHIPWQGQRTPGLSEMLAAVGQGQSTVRAEIRLSSDVMKIHETVRTEAFPFPSK